MPQPYTLDDIQAEINRRAALQGQPAGASPVAPTDAPGRSLVPGGSTQPDATPMPVQGTAPGRALVPGGESAPQDDGQTITDYGVTLRKALDRTGAAMGYGLQKLGFNETGQAVRDLYHQREETAPAQSASFQAQEAMPWSEAITHPLTAAGKLTADTLSAAPDMGLAAAATMATGGVGGPAILGKILGGAAGGGAFGLEGAERAAYDVEKMPEDKLRATPAFQDAYAQAPADMPEADRVATARKEAANAVAGATFRANVGLGAVTGGTLGPAADALKEWAPGLVSSIVAGSGEGAGFMGGQRVAENAVRQSYVDPNTSLTEGLPDALIGGAVFGGAHAAIKGAPEGTPESMPKANVKDLALANEKALSDPTVDPELRSQAAYNIYERLLQKMPYTAPAWEERSMQAIQDGQPVDIHPELRKLVGDVLPATPMVAPEKTSAEQPEPHEAQAATPIPQEGQQAPQVAEPQSYSREDLAQLASGSLDAKDQLYEIADNFGIQHPHKMDTDALVGNILSAQDAQQVEAQRQVEAAQAANDMQAQAAQARQDIVAAKSDADRTDAIQRFEDATKSLAQIPALPAGQGFDLVGEPQPLANTAAQRDQMARQVMQPEPDLSGQAPAQETSPTPQQPESPQSAAPGPFDRENEQAMSGPLPPPEAFAQKYGIPATPEFLDAIKTFQQITGENGVPATEPREAQALDLQRRGVEAEIRAAEARGEQPDSELLVERDSINRQLAGEPEPQSATPQAAGILSGEQFPDALFHRANQEARDEQGRLLAPNGQPSNLDEEQHQAVRTIPFRRLAGHWDYDPQKQVPVVEVDPSALAGVDLKNTRAVSQWLKENLAESGPVTVKSTGEEVGFTRDNLNASLKRRGTVQRQAYSGLRDLLANAEYFDFEPADAKHAVNLDGQDVYFSSMSIGGKDYAVKIKVDVAREDKAQTYKDHKVSEIQIAPVVSPAHSPDGKASGTTESLTGLSGAIRNYNIDTLAGGVKPRAASIPLDANGEPLSASMGSDGAFRKSLSARGIPSQTVEEWLAPVRDRLAGHINLKVANTPDDIPAADRARMSANDPNWAQNGTGWGSKDGSYIFAWNLTGNKNEVRALATHEVKHQAMYRVFERLAEEKPYNGMATQQMAKVLNPLVDARRGEIETLMHSQYGKDFNPANRLHMLIGASEWLADAKNVEPKLYEKFMSAIRAALRSVGEKLDIYWLKDMKMSDAEIHTFNARVMREALQSDVPVHEMPSYEELNSKRQGQLEEGNSHEGQKQFNLDIMPAAAFRRDAPLAGNDEPAIKEMPTDDIVRDGGDAVNRMFSHLDTAKYQGEREARQVQRDVQALTNGTRDASGITLQSTKDTQASRNVDEAMHVYRDMKINPQAYEDYKNWAYDRMAGNPTTDVAGKLEAPATPREKREIKEHLSAIDRANSLTPEQRQYVDTALAPKWDALTARMRKLGLLQPGSEIENYVRRIWGKKDGEKMPGGFGGAGTGLKLTTTASKQRSLETLADGWRQGMDLKDKGISQAYGALLGEVNQIEASKNALKNWSKLTDADGNRIVQTYNPGPGWVRLKDPRFDVWKAVGKAEANPDGYAGKEPEFSVDNNGRRSYLTPPAEIGGGGQRSTLMEKSPVYMPKDIGDAINRVTSTESFFRDTPALRALMRANNEIKSTVLMTSLFHHFAMSRAWLFGVDRTGGTVDMGNGQTMEVKPGSRNPLEAARQGLNAIDENNPIVEHLVKNGMTLGASQDWDMHKDDGLIVKTAKASGIEGLVKVAEGGAHLREKAESYLFKQFMPGLKASAGMLEYARQLKAEESKLGRATTDAEKNLVAQRVARVTNENFGGLHQGRMGRSRQAQDAARLIFLAPDWTESNLRSAIGVISPKINDAIDKVIGGLPSPEGMTPLYRQFWGRVMFRGVAATMLANLAVTGGAAVLGGDDKAFDKLCKFYRDQFSSWDQFNRLQWTGVLLDPVYKMLGVDTGKNSRVLSLLGHFTDPMKTLNPDLFLKHKESPVLKIGGAFSSGSDYADRPFNSTKDFLATGSMVKSNRYENKEPFFNRLPATIAHELLGVAPLQGSSIVKAVTGSGGMDWPTAVAQSGGLAVSSVSPPYYKGQLASDRMDILHSFGRAIAKGNVTPQEIQSFQRQAQEYNQNAINIIKENNLDKEEWPILLHGGWMQQAAQRYQKKQLKAKR